MNYYQTLGVDNNATSDEIRKAYRTLVKSHHPDKGGDADKFTKISEAYEHLGNPDKRRQYDITQQSGFHGIEDFLKRSGSYQDAFDKAFGNKAKGPQLNASVLLTLDEVYYGTSRAFDFGEGPFKVNIKPGVYDGMKLTIHGRGRVHPVNTAATRGDLVITIRIDINHDIVIQGSDIWCSSYVPFYDMILGTEIDVNTPFSKIKVKVGKNTKNDKVLRIKGKGFPIYNTTKHGNLMIKLKASFDINKEQEKLIQLIKDKE